MHHPFTECMIGSVDDDEDDDDDDDDDEEERLWRVGSPCRSSRSGRPGPKPRAEPLEMSGTLPAHSARARLVPHQPVVRGATRKFVASRSRSRSGGPGR